ncbi:DUF4224 domain-containing protein [Paraburkholderia sp. BR10872]|uniref:DUF4224 domain-containing protein n=1 Tax=Paraburkholderia sp. BR10872 TaxID=3236989 RepID=UPI0034D278BB
MFLDEEELTELTRKQQNAARIRVLNAIGVQHKIRPDGTIAVLRQHVEEVFGLKKPKKEEGSGWVPSWLK